VAEEVGAGEGGESGEGETGCEGRWGMEGMAEGGGGLFGEVRCRHIVDDVGEDWLFWS